MKQDDVDLLHGVNSHNIKKCKFGLKDNIQLQFAFKANIVKKMASNKGNVCLRV